MIDRARRLLLPLALAALAACRGNGAADGDPPARDGAQPDTARAGVEAVGPGVTVDTQRIDSAAADIYTPTDSADR